MQTFSQTLQRVPPQVAQKPHLRTMFSMLVEDTVWRISFKWWGSPGLKYSDKLWELISAASSPCHCVISLIASSPPWGSSSQFTIWGELEGGATHLGLAFHREAPVLGPCLHNECCTSNSLEQHACINHNDNSLREFCAQGVTQLRSRLSAGAAISSEACGHFPISLTVRGIWFLAAAVLRTPHHPLAPAPLHHRSAASGPAGRYVPEPLLKDSLLRVRRTQNSVSWLPQNQTANQENQLCQGVYSHQSCDYKIMFTDAVHIHRGSYRVCVPASKNPGAIGEFDPCETWPLNGPQWSDSHIPHWPGTGLSNQQNTAEMICS